MIATLSFLTIGFSPAQTQGAFPAPPNPTAVDMSSPVSDHKLNPHHSPIETMSLSHHKTWSSCTTHNPTTLPSILSSPLLCPLLSQACVLPLSPWSTILLFLLTLLILIPAVSLTWSSTTNHRWVRLFQHTSSQAPDPMRAC